jgi:hypothetical protein
MQPKLAVGIDYSMSGIIATGETHNYPGFFGKQVNHITFSLISPLSPNNSNNRHFFLLTANYFLSVAIRKLTSGRQ